MKAAVRWLFSDTDGHAALALLCLAGSAVCAKYGVPHAEAGITAFSALFLAKLRT